MRKHMIRDGKIGINRIVKVISKECGLGQERGENKEKCINRATFLTVHLRLPKVAKDDLSSWQAQEPLGSSKVKETEEICPYLKFSGLRVHKGSCRIVRAV